MNRGDRDAVPNVHTQLTTILLAHDSFYHYKLTLRSLIPFGSQQFVYKTVIARQQPTVNTSYIRVANNRSHTCTPVYNWYRHACTYIILYQVPLHSCKLPSLIFYATVKSFNCKINRQKEKLAYNIVQFIVWQGQVPAMPDCLPLLLLYRVPVNTGKEGMSP